MFAFKFMFVDFYWCLIYIRVCKALQSILFCTFVTKQDRLCVQSRWQASCDRNKPEEGSERRQNCFPWAWKITSSKRDAHIGVCKSKAFLSLILSLIWKINIYWICFGNQISLHLSRFMIRNNSLCLILVYQWHDTQQFPLFDAGLPVAWYPTSLWLAQSWSLN